MNCNALATLLESENRSDSDHAIHVCRLAYLSRRQESFDPVRTRNAGLRDGRSFGVFLPVSHPAVYFFPVLETLYSEA